MTSKMLLEQYMAERHALGFSLKTDEGCIRRFLQDFAEPDDGEISFTKEYVLDHIGNRRNLQTNTILRDVSAINGFLDFVIRKGYTAYKIPPKSLPKENRNFRAYIFTDDEIERMLTAADHVPFTEQNPARKYQIPVMFRILFNCGLRTSELLKLRMCDVNLKENVFTILDTKFHKNRLVPFSDTVAESLTQYLEMSPPKSTDSLLFPSLNPRSNGGRYGNKLNFASSSERRVFLTMVQEKALGLMISATHLRYTVLTTGSFRVKILPLRYPYFHGILDIMD